MRTLVLLSCLLITITSLAQSTSKWVFFDKDNHLSYYKDSLGNCIPDFSAVGYRYGKEDLPDGKVVATYTPSGSDDTHNLQQLIDSVSHLSSSDHKIIELKAGQYTVSNTLYIKGSNIILRGNGSNENGTVITYTSTQQSDLITIAGKGKPEEVEREAQPITDAYVPVGTKELHVKNAASFKINQAVLIKREATPAWIHALHMDSIPNLREGGKSWSANGFELNYERIITHIDAATGLITLNAPIVMALDNKYGISTVVPYTYKGRLQEVGIENLLLKSTYTTETDEQHGWCAIKLIAAQNCWVQNIVSLHFGNNCVNIASSSKNITVLNCTCLDPISIITGGRRYSFNCDGQLNLFKNCTARNGRHDFVTGARVCGPNVFTHCIASFTHADIGPHHRWATGTLYDNIVSDGEMNAQNRGFLGTGHGWSGAYQVFWNCSSKTAAIQNPPMAYNWSIGYKGNKVAGRFTDDDGIWEANNTGHVMPVSLYNAQVIETKQ